MSILSDRQIRERCIRPGYKTYQEIYSEVAQDPEFAVEQFAHLNHPSLAAHLAAREKAQGLYRQQDLPMIHPFVDEQVRSVDGQKIVSYGNSSYGYDVRCAPEFKVFTNINSTIVDPKKFDDKCFVDVEGSECIIPPNSFALARTVEYFCIPRDTLVVCLGKSTYARCGIIVNVTPLEPEWEGHVTLEFSNTTPLPARIYANEGVAQFLFFQNTDGGCETSYKDRGGKYMGQVGVNPPRM